MWRSSSAALLVSIIVLASVPGSALAARPKLSSHPPGSLPGSHRRGIPAAPAPGAQALPRTGIDLSLEALAGLALLTLGSLSRRRATHG